MRDSKVNTAFLFPVICTVVTLMQAFQVISLGSTHPDFMMLMTIIYAFSRGSFKGEIFGFAMGMLLDLLSGALFGINAFVFTLLGALSQSFQKIAKLPNFIVFVLYVVSATILKYILYHIFFVIYKDTGLLDLYFFIKIPAEILINLVFGVILYILCSMFDSRENYEWF